MYTYVYICIERLDLYITILIVLLVLLACSYHLAAWPTLRTRRSYLELLSTYKTLKAKISIPSDKFKRVTLNTRDYRSHFKYLQIVATYSYLWQLLFLLFPSSIRLWNCLPTDITFITSFNDFNMKLQHIF